MVILIRAAGREGQLFRRFGALAFDFAALAGLEFFAFPRLVAVVGFLAAPDFRGADLRGAVFILAAVFAGLLDVGCADLLAAFAGFAAAGLAALARAGSFSMAAGASSA